ncbi:hypothetical protein JQN58_08365 [Aneurinibacillus sp. BA2021]|nr:hypothetical protein [Aneurinibacillus sp. BA2021]
MKKKGRSKIPAIAVLSTVAFMGLTTSVFAETTLKNSTINGIQVSSGAENAAIKAEGTTTVTGNVKIEAPVSITADTAGVNAFNSAVVDVNTTGTIQLGVPLNEVRINSNATIKTSGEGKIVKAVVAPGVTLDLPEGTVVEAAVPNVTLSTNIANIAKGKVKLVGTTNKMEYQVKTKADTSWGTDWISINENDIEISAVAGDMIRVRVKKAENVLASQPKELTVTAHHIGEKDESPTPEAPAAPEGLKGVAPTSAEATDGKITGLNAEVSYEYKAKTDADWIELEANSTEITGLVAGDYEVRMAATAGTPASLAATVKVPAYAAPTPEAPAAPKGLEGVAPTSAEGTDGKITGLDAKVLYQYKAEADEEWTDVAADSTEITGLVAGDYEVRMAATAGTPASLAATVKVPAYAAPTPEAPAAPKGLEGVAPTSAEGTDGKITGLDAKVLYQYKAEADEEWTDVAADSTEITGLVAGDYEVRMAATAGTPASLAATVKVPAYAAPTPEAPAAPKGLEGVAPTSAEGTDGKITGLDAKVLYQYKAEADEEWTDVAADSTEITGLVAGDYEVRMAATAGTPASLAATVKVPAYAAPTPEAPAAPKGLEGVAPTSVEGTDGKITGLDAKVLYQYKAEADEEWTDVAADSTEITGLVAGDYEVRMAATAGTPASLAATVKVPAYAAPTPEAPAAPKGLEGVAPTSAEGTDGKITGLDAKVLYQYKAEADEEWTDVAADSTEITGLVAGDYEVRMAATAGTPASLAATVKVPAYAAPTPEAPAAPKGLEGVAPTSAEGTDGKITGLDAKVLYQYKAEADEEWTDVAADSTEITGLVAGDYEVRMAATAGTPASLAATVKVPAYAAPTPEAPAAPKGLEGVAPTSVEGTDGKITGLDAKVLYQYKAEADEEWTDVAADSTEITGLVAGDYEVRMAATAGTPASLAATVKVPAYAAPTPEAPAAPKGLEGVAPTSAEGTDGKITGLDAKVLYQYKAEADEEWTDVAADSTEITGLVAGDYEVRMAATAGTPASLAATVKVPANN